MNPRTPGAAPPPAGGPIGRGSSFPMTPSPANPTTPPSPAGSAVNRGPGANQSHASPGMHSSQPSLWGFGLICIHLFCLDVQLSKDYVKIFMTTSSNVSWIPKHIPYPSVTAELRLCRQDSSQDYFFDFRRDRPLMLRRTTTPSPMMGTPSPGNVLTGKQV